MADLLYKLQKKKTSKVAQISAEMVEYEMFHPKYAIEIKPLAATNYEIGIEIEIENVPDEMVQNEDEQPSGPVVEYPIWICKEDHSLRNKGMEFVSIPIEGPRIHYALNQFFDVINADAHFSPRTSIHVHLNVLDLTPEQIGGAIIVFCAFEKLIYQWIGGDRDKNNFCVPFYEAKAYGLINSFITTPFTGTPVGGDNRYLGLNLHAIHKFGSLEFRQLGGTFNKDRIIDWINILFCIKQYAEKTPVATILSIINELNTTSAYIAFYNDVFGHFGTILNPRNIMVNMEEIVSYLKGFTNVLNKPRFDAKDYWYTRLMRKDKKQPSMKIEFAPRQPFNIPPARERVGNTYRRPEPLISVSPMNFNLDDISTNQETLEDAMHRYRVALGETTRRQD